MWREYRLSGKASDDEGGTFSCVQVALRAGYLAVDRSVVGAPGRGVGVFAQIGVAPEDRNELSRYFGDGRNALAFGLRLQASF